MNTKVDALWFALMEHLGPAALTGGTMSVYDAFVLGWNAAPQAAAINAELLAACKVAFDQTCSVGRPKDWEQLRAAIAKATGEEA